MNLSNVDVNRLAASLRTIDTQGAGRLPNEHRVWLQGDENYFDVFVDLDTADQPTWFQITLRGRIYTWEAASQRVWTGFTNERSTQPRHPTVKMITSESTPDPVWVACVKDLLAASQQHPLLQRVLDRLP